jgi:diguanylate cyclase (GGDEF)-like protein
LHPRLPDEVERALEEAGFHAVETTLLGEELVALEYERIHSRQTSMLSLRSTCPVVVDWVRLFYPELVSALAPIVPPYVAQARLVKSMYADDVAVIYVSPCYARKDEIRDPQFAGAVDAAIDFTELERLLASATVRSRVPGARTTSRPPMPIKEVSLTDGFPRTTLAGDACIDGKVMAVRGLRELDELLGAVVRGEVAPFIIDMLNCEGCIDGPAVHPGLSVFAKRNIVTAEKEASPATRISTRDLLAHVPPVELVRSLKARPVFEEAVTAEQVNASLADGEFTSREEVLDCGACGYTTCVDHAAAVFRSMSSWDMCLPLQQKRHSRFQVELKRTATVDALTGLLNRRAFDERLSAEVSRSVRYDTPLSLLMFDVDSFKEVNDALGHPAGDRVLRAVADVVRAQIREADVAFRYGGDEFALLLPATTKTAAFAVAEKLRGAVASRPLAGGDGGIDSPSGVVRVTISVGVASVQGATGTPLGLLESADRALYQAKRSGRDQVRIAAG